jgi:DNA-binding NtrC family response regulator
MIVDDSDSYRETLERRFSRNRFNQDTPYKIISANSAASAIEKISACSGTIDAFLIDIRMETDNAGITLIEYIRRKEQFKYSPIIVITGQPGEYSENRIKHEYLIHGYINKSDNVDVLEEVRKIIVQHKISKKNELNKFRTEVERNMGSCKKMQEVFNQIENCSRIENPVIYIDGETGTGKSLIAGYFHNISNKGGVFIDYNCSTPVGTDENILKSILFGAKKGFLSADHKGNEGLIKQAENGTLFLDEFQNVSIEIQSMLIKVIESKQYRSLGSEELRKCNISFLIAGNKDIKELVNEKLIREDFYFRIHDIVKVPPLRERKSDIPYFIDKFLQESNRSLRKYVSISDGAVEKMEKYNWPGNVRQLKHVMERAVLHCKGYEISANEVNLDNFDNTKTSLLTPNTTVPDGNDFYSDLKVLIEKYLEQNKNIIHSKNPKERRILFDFDIHKTVLLNCVMNSTGGNKKATAQLLGLTVEQLATLLKNAKTNPTM